MKCTTFPSRDKKKKKAHRTCKKIYTNESVAIFLQCFQYLVRFSLRVETLRL